MANELAKYALNVARAIQGELSTLKSQNALDVSEITVSSSGVEQEVVPSWLNNDRIYTSLKNISEVLANSYAQIKIDIQDDSRLSWAGTAHEIRQLLSTLLETLAPDEEVIKQPWYKQEPQTKGPTQKQRTRYLLQTREAGSKVQEVADQVTNLDEWIGNIVRATYSRASDAAHRFKEQKEVLRILRYFEAFAQDLLDLE